ncbi:DEAD/DEAH box helicase [Oribacterium sp. NK2B42]|uniref:DEAD/DEAH box helicase n=1 Tax=Oribacterium sp. NK2B42 TaxID=689781 RepID=UPI0004202203|nr:DEAD/DEAH box helicase [Oribacterium sp. NK2B42]
MSMNPRTTTDKIKKDYKRYVSSILTVRDKEISKLAKEEVYHTNFVKGPFLETTLPFKDGKTLKELAEEGLVSTEFSKMGKRVHYEDWKLRVHQENALRHIIEDNRNMVVSTGTGSGKTECYLYPIFNQLMREKEQGNLDAGVRALLIFPMNALANDQQKKLRKLLAEYPDITFGRYTGETLHAKTNEEPEDAEKRLHKEYDVQHQDDTDSDSRKSIPNEYMCREFMAKNPPHILLTNYAMLEYMLLQPNTAPFFDTSKAKNWKFIVIDEAHTYKGATGTEIAFLLRRLKERIKHHRTEDFRCIATSATLGTEGGKAALAEFASQLFGEPFNENDVITTERKKREQSSGSRNFSLDEYKKLKEEVADMPDWEKGKYLYEKLVNDNRLFLLYDILQDKPKDIIEVADAVFYDLKDISSREESLITLIELSAAAKKSEFESALLPARYHLFVKSLEGMFVQYYPRKRVFLDRKEKNRDATGEYSVFEMANCQKCGQEYILGKTIYRNGKNYLVQTSASEKPEFYFISDKNIIDETFDEDDNLDEKANFSSLDKYKLCLSCGRISEYAEETSYNCCKTNDPGKIVTVYNLRYSGKGKESNCCPSCGATKEGLIKRFLTANQPATFAVAKSLYDAIPPRPINGKSSSSSNELEDDLFSDDLFGDILPESVNIDERVIDESGRKLLVFSDNRQEAAFFAGFFEKKYRLAMWRKVILNCLKEADGGELSVDDLIAKAKQLADREGLYALDLVEQNNNLDASMMGNEQKKAMAAHYIMSEFISPDIATGLEGMGYIQIMPQELPLKSDASRYGVNGGKNIWKVYRFVFDTLRQKGAVTFPSEISAEDDFFSPRNHVRYFRISGNETLYKKGYIYGFMPSEGHKNKRSAMFKKILSKHEAEEENESIAISNLEQCYDDITKVFKNKGYISDDTSNESGVIYELNYRKWKFKYIKPEENIFRCKKCGKIFSYSLMDLCPELKCDGELETIAAGDVRKDNYYDSLYGGEQFVPMVAREHTAQLSSKTAGQYQKLFEEGAINVLSCSTTFEMGVDVGELEATFQRNVPPETSNYIQRAGRAGRRTSSAAFSVTFARRNSHDMTFFQNPAEIISGKIAAPLLEVDNEKIAQRHLNSIIIASFFKLKPEFFKDKTKRIVAYETKDNMAVELEKYLDTKPQELLDTIHNVFDEKLCDLLKVDDWGFVKDLLGDSGKLNLAIKEREADISGLTELKKNINPDSTGKELSEARAVTKLIETLNDEASISFLSSKGVLPKYGFPIDTVSLDILNNKNKEAEKLDLSRDLRMAISEFAPPAQIVANGKQWKSYAINTIPDKSWPTYVYHECPKCKRIFPPKGEMTEVTINIDDSSGICPDCKIETNPKKFIIPLFGFSTSYSEKPKMVGETRPRAYYATQTQYWCDTDLTERQQLEVKSKKTIINGKEVSAKYSPGGKLFVLNQGTNGAGIYVCPECGYATEIDKLYKEKSHKNKYGHKCSNKMLQRVSLGHVFSTDILKIQLPEHDIELTQSGSLELKNQDLSVMYSILEGASSALDINRGDISGCVTGNHQIILYDDTPGGSGFVKHIYEHIEDVLSKAKEKVNGSCGCTEETSCYGCLRNYGNQYFHDVLSRGIAYRYLDWLLSDSSITNVNCEEKTDKLISNVNTKLEKGVRVISDYSGSDYDDKRNTIDEVYIEFMSMDDDELSKNEKAIFEKVYNKLKDKDYENPVMYNKIELKEGDVWPSVFWPNSKVALFWKGQKEHFDLLKTYDWYCFMLDESLNIDDLLSVISIIERNR